MNPSSNCSSPEYNAPFGSAPKFPLKVVFLCGDRSPYGLAHLEPVLNSSFRVSVIVLPTRNRWNQFYEALNGKQYYPLECNSIAAVGLRSVKKLISPVWSAMRSYKHNNRRNSVRRLLKRYSTDVIFIDDVNSAESVDLLQKLEPDLLISAAYPQIFSKNLLSVPKLGSVNFHPSNLPRFRGAHPHFWAVATGASESGVTAHFMTEKLDEGDIIAQKTFSIEGKTYNELYSRIIKETPELVKEVDDFFRNGGTPRPQEPSGASLFRNDRAIHKRVSWSLHNAVQIENLARTQQAYFFYLGERVGIAKAVRRDRNRNMTNGVLVEDGTLVDVTDTGGVVKVQDGFVELQRVYVLIGWRRIFGGEKEVQFSDWAMRRKLDIGERLQ